MKQYFIFKNSEVNVSEYMHLSALLQKHLLYRFTLDWQVNVGCLSVFLFKLLKDLLREGKNKINAPAIFLLSNLVWFLFCFFPKYEAVFPNSASMLKQHDFKKSVFLI